MSKPETGLIWLASRSARRVKMLSEAGFDVDVIVPEIDDSDLVRGGASVTDWVMGLAYLKARSGAESLRARGERDGLVIGADTVCFDRGEVLGQPCDEDDARQMITRMSGGEHDVFTGLCVYDMATGSRCVTFDRAIVRLGDITESQLADHLSSGAWVGKAGAYNFEEQVAAGWDIDCLGDPTTVMGLPMRRLELILDRHGACD